MTFITLDQARSQTHSDGVDEDMLPVYIGAAERNAAQFMNRRVFADESSLNSAIAAVPTALQAAVDAREAALEALDDLDGSVRCVVREAADEAFEAAKTLARETYRGIVINEDILAGMLLILGHLFRNREAVMTGQGAAAIELPMGAYALLWPYRVDIGV